MTETELRFGEVVGLQALEKLRCVEPDGANEVLRGIVSVALEAKSSLDS